MHAVLYKTSRQGWMFQLVFFYRYITKLGCIETYQGHRNITYTYTRLG